MRVDVAFIPPARVPIEATCLVVDVLRATSVMAVLFGRGLRAAWLAGSIEEGRAIRAALGDRPRGLMLCGEEHALPPTGFDYGNSPLEFERVALPAEAVLATSNGTPALLACAGAPLVLPAAPLNAGAAVNTALNAGRDVLIVCSGSVEDDVRVPSDDDTIAAGQLVERLVRAGLQPGDEVHFALERYEAARADLATALRRTPHGARLVELGFGADVDRCAQVDVYDTVALLRLEDGRPVLRTASERPR